LRNAFVETMLGTPSGAEVRMHSMMPDRGIRAAVHINHGMAEHSARYERFARSLVAQGYAVYAHDHRGHGGTHAPDAPKGVFGSKFGFEKVIADVLAVNARIRASDPDMKVICFGHSMGSIIALNFALRHPDLVAGLACWNAGVTTGGLTAASRLILGSESLFRGRNKASGIAKKLTFDAWNKEFKPTRTEFDWLSRDPDEVGKYVADPQCGFDVSIGLWLDLMEGIYYGANDHNLAALSRDMPVHIQGGAKDPCSNHGEDMKKLTIRLGKAGLTDVSCSILPDTRHESLNEINRDATTDAFLSWLNARF